MLYMYIAGKKNPLGYSSFASTLYFRGCWWLSLGCSGGGHGQHGTDYVAQDSSDLEFFPRIRSILLMHPYRVRSTLTRENDYSKEKKAKK